MCFLHNEVKDMPVVSLPYLETVIKVKLRAFLTSV